MPCALVGSARTAVIKEDARRIGAGDHARQAPSHGLRGSCGLPSCEVMIEGVALDVRGGDRHTEGATRAGRYPPVSTSPKHPAVTSARAARERSEQRRDRSDEAATTARVHEAD